jgi:hypothetical protein
MKMIATGIIFIDFLLLIDKKFPRSFNVVSKIYDGGGHVRKRLAESGTSPFSRT